MAAACGRRRRFGCAERRAALRQRPLDVDAPVNAPLRIAIGFLTRFPFAVHASIDARDQARSVAWYPAVGVLIGSVLATLAVLLRDAPPLLASALLVVAWVACTGALHLDGLADSADAWIGGMGDRTRTLAIMKDPRSGPAGVVALVLVLLVKFAALASLRAPAWPALLLAPTLARAGLVALVIGTPYARENGLATPLLAAPRAACAMAVAATVAAACFAFGRSGIVASIVCAIVWLLLRRASMRRLGGYTGDTAGALAECLEAATLTVLALGA
jgi:adenosylcobinamide-GDP ribazoletransferase